ncbi:histidine kinase dimerization/phosphoacceptor domain-containing protein [Actinokineospora inagensis]|uniref:histidine kinase dimerization/phosphoacceptor domain-containing protein n=1 Tax=Actinokineospora inagensis TaxID=103730 RepID=UPI000405A5C9|nr:histidine kinase dimerization/phosphoacceptor domain-containing protein [Actinokineospora inagensis]
MSPITRWWRRVRPLRLRPVDPTTCALRRGLERELNDGPAQRVAALAVELGLLSVDLPDDPALTGRVAELQGGLAAVLAELREIGGVLFPPVLASDGLEPALHAVAERRGVAIAVHSDLVDQATAHAAGLAVADHLRSVPRDTQVAVRVRRHRGTARVDVTEERGQCG